MKVIIYMDGFCNLCYGFASLVINNSPKGKFEFHHLPPPSENEHYPNDTVIVKTQDGRTLYQSDAVRYVLKQMNVGFQLIGALIAIFPLGFRNKIYQWIALNRYKWFGKSSTCRLPHT